MKKNINKKGATTEDVLMVAVILFVISIGLFITHFSVTKTMNIMINNTQVNSSSATTQVLNQSKTLLNRLDMVILGFFTAFIITMMILSWHVQTNPIFLFISLIILIIGVLVAATLSNIWSSISQSSVFGTTVVNFPITTHLMNNWAMYITIIGIISIGIMFGKPNKTRR